MTDTLKIKLAAREIKRVIERVRLGERDLDQALIDIANQADFILRELDEDATTTQARNK